MGLGFWVLLLVGVCEIVEGVYLFVFVFVGLIYIGFVVVNGQGYFKVVDYFCWIVFVDNYIVFICLFLVFVVFVGVQIVVIFGSYF